MWSGEIKETAGSPRSLTRLKSAVLARLLSAMGIVLISFGLAAGLSANRPVGDNPSPALAAVTIDYPVDHTLFPPDFAPPTFLWRDADPNAKVWRIEVSFADRFPSIQISSPANDCRSVQSMSVARKPVLCRPHSLLKRPPATPGNRIPPPGRRSCATPPNTQRR